MSAILVSAFLAFVEGIGLIFSPCILPILPIILSGSLSGRKTRPYGIILGFIITFTIVTLFSRALVIYLHIDTIVLRYVAYILLFLFGLVMVSTYLTERFNTFTARLTNVGTSLKTANDNESGFVGGLLFGGLVGIIFTPCAGPILAAVLVQAIVQSTTIGSVIVVAAFAMGVSVPMFLIAIFGRNILQSVMPLQQYANAIRKTLGLLIIISVGYIIYSTTYTAAAIEKMAVASKADKFIDGIAYPYAAPAIAGIDAWINSPPLDLTALKGKVVLIDFWTYSCINCIRTLPYLKDWYEKYHDKGLVIIGIHSPEFEFEQNIENVKKAVLEFGIKYPVALDNQFRTWRNYENKYWPAHYLINQKGEVVYEHFGEGSYEVTENNIRYLLKVEGENKLLPSPKNSSSWITPETYLGYGRMQSFATPDNINQETPVLFNYPSSLALNYWALSGTWIIFRDNIEATTAGSSIKLHFNAAKVYAVMGAPTKPIDVTVTVTLEGKVLSTKKMHINHTQLYTLVELKDVQVGTVEIRTEQPGLEMFTFTFGD